EVLRRPHLGEALIGENARERSIHELSDRLKVSIRELAGITRVNDRTPKLVQAPHQLKDPPLRFGETANQVGGSEANAICYARPGLRLREQRFTRDRIQQDCLVAAR